MDLRRGRFVVLDGSDGVGKATQTDRLVKKLREEGHRVHVLDFPQYGKNLFADTVSAYLRNEFGLATRVDPYLASLPYTLDRFKVAPEIRESLRKGEVVVSNRFTSASVGHQGAKIIGPEKRAQYIEWLNRAEFSREGLDLPRPDLTVILDVDPVTAHVLVGRKGDREYTRGKRRDAHERDLDYQKRVAEVFREVTASDPTWRLINCMSSQGKGILRPETIAKKVWGVVSPYLSRSYESSD